MPIRNITAENRQQVVSFFKQHWGSSEMVISSGVFKCDELEGFLYEENAEVLGLVTYVMHEGALEVISLDSAVEGKGVGSKLMQQTEQFARQQGIRVVSLITTNDNLYALKFYQKRGYQITAVFPNAVDKARAIKPSIPPIGNDGIAIRDELQLVKKMEKQVTIEPYNADWARQFQQESALIQQLIGDSIIAIEHFGSTSVEGLGAKPIVDIMMGVKDLEVAQAFVEPLAALGYEQVFHAQFPERRFFRKGERGAGTHHLHVYEFGGEQWRHKLLFRDYLRQHPETRQQYYDLKQELAEKYAFDRATYTEEKGSFVKSVLRKGKAL